MTTSASEPSSTFILYLTPQQLPSISADQDTTIASDGSLPVSCAALPASSEPLQSGVASAVKSATEDGIRRADDADIAGKLSVRDECVEDVIESTEGKGSTSVDNVLTVVSTDAMESHGDSAGQSKVFSVIQATLSSDVMSVIVEMHCWDVLETAADACSVQLLHDASDSICIAVGHTMNSFCELERVLMSLLTSVVTSCHVTNDRPEPQTSAVRSQLLAVTNIVSSATAAAVSVTIDSESETEMPPVSDSGGRCEDDLTDTVSQPTDNDQQLRLSSHASKVDLISEICTNPSETNTKPMCRQFTRSGRQVKSKKFADFLSSDTIVREPLQSGLPVNKTSLKHHRDQPSKPLNTGYADNIENLQHNTVEASSSQQRQLVNAICDEQSQMDTYDGVADGNTDNGKGNRPQMSGDLQQSGSVLYNGRTRLESREYEQLMPYRYFCTQCSFRSKRVGHMRRHEHLHARGVAVLQCEVCAYRTTSTNHLTRHRLHQHTERSSKVLCSMDGCTYVASSKRQLQKHLTSRRHSCLQTSSPLPCPVSGCSYTTTTATRLLRHKTRHRTVDGQDHPAGSASLVDRYHCTKCSYETTHREHFRRHVDSVHNNVRLFLCDVCGRRFKRQDALLQHSLVVHNNQSDQSENTMRLSVHRCTMCERTFRSKSHLSDHESSVHNSSRSFTCTHCGAAFKTRAVHRKHLLTIHTHPGTHVCAVCQRVFNTSFAMKRHSRMHSLPPTERATLYFQPPSNTVTDSLQTT